MTTDPKDTPPPATPKPRRPHRLKLNAEPSAAVQKADAKIANIKAQRLRVEPVQIPADTDPASAFRADMQLRKAIAERRLAALEAKRASVDGDRTDKKALIDSEAAAKKERLDNDADEALVKIDDESASVIRSLAGIGAALDASQPPALDAAAHTGVGGYIGLHRANVTDYIAMDALRVTHENLSAEEMAEIDRRQQERLKGTDQ